jgi:hypothetical protein
MSKKDNHEEEFVMPEVARAVEAPTNQEVDGVPGMAIPEVIDDTRHILNLSGKVLTAWLTKSGERRKNLYDVVHVSLEDVNPRQHNFVVELAIQALRRNGELNINDKFKDLPILSTLRKQGKVYKKG